MHPDVARQHGGEGKVPEEQLQQDWDVAKEFDIGRA